MPTPQATLFLIAAFAMGTSAQPAPTPKKAPPRPAQATVPSTAAVAMPDPVATIRDYDRRLQSSLRRWRNPTPAQRDSLKVMINSIFSFEELGRRALGARWSTLKPVQQQEFLALFRSVVEASTVERIASYRSDSARYEPATGTGDRTRVAGTVWASGRPTRVEYRLLPVDGTWKAWDLVLDDLSTMRNYRDQFRAILDQHGFDGLLQRLRERSAR